MDMASAIREALEGVWKNHKIDKKKRKKNPEMGACFGPRFELQNEAVLEPE